MTHNLLIVKHETRELEFLRDCHTLSKEMVTEMGKSLAWLQFARRRPSGGYQFDDRKDMQWQTLASIIEKLSKTHSHLTTGKITDILSHIVNTTACDMLEDVGVTHTKHAKVTGTKDSHLHKTLVHHTKNEIYLPRHPWIKVEKVVDTSLWVVHDFAMKKTSQIRKKIVGEYTHFIFMP